MQDELCHFGIKGMKWGVRKDKVTPSGKTTSQLRAMDKANRSSDRVERKAARKKARSDFWKETSERDLEIKRSRERRADLYKESKDAKNLYKTERYEIGKYAAKKHLKKTLAEINEEFAIGFEKTGREQFFEALFGVAAKAEASRKARAEASRKARAEA